MASLIDSIKTVVGDSHPFFKIAGLSLIVYFVMQLDKINYVPSDLRTIAMALTIFGLIGYALLSVHNTVNEKNILLPNLFNPIKLIWIGLLGFISLLPFIAIVYYGITWLMPLLKFEPWINYLILVIAFAILSSVLVVAMVLFCKNFKPLESYILKYTIKYIGDFIVYNLTLAFSVTLLLGIVFFPIGLGVKIMFDYGEIFTLFLIFTIIFVVMCMMQYYSQLYFEYIALSDN